MNDLTFFASTLHTQRAAELRREAQIRELRAARADDSAAAPTPSVHGLAPRHRHARRSAVAAAR